MIKAVIIDFDDTLSLTEESCFHLENEALRRMGRPLMSREIHRQTWGQPLGDAMQVRSPGVDLEEFWPLWSTVHAEFLATNRIDIVTEDNIAVLDALLVLGKKLMILTSRTETEVLHLLDPDHHLSDRLVAFYHKDNTVYHKPDPRAFQMIEHDHGLKPEECVYIGDSPTDAAASNGAGVHFIACLESGLRKHQDFKGYNIDVFIKRFTDVVDAVLALDAAA